MLEIGLVAWSVLYLLKAGHEYSFLGKRIFLDNMKMCPSRLDFHVYLTPTRLLNICCLLEHFDRVMFLIGCVTVLLMVPARVFCLTNLEDVLATMSMFCHGFYFLFFCRGIKLVITWEFWENKTRRTTSKMG